MHAGSASAHHFLLLLLLGLAHLLLLIGVARTIQGLPVEARLGLQRVAARHCEAPSKRRTAHRLYVSPAVVAIQPLVRDTLNFEMSRRAESSAPALRPQLP